MRTLLAFFKSSPQDLFRSAKKTSPNLSNSLRPRDVKVSELGNVNRESGGISLFNYKNPSLRGSDQEWWVLVEGKQLPDGLILARDSDTHYLLLPSWEMSLDNYKKLLMEAEPLFINYKDYVQRKTP